MNFITQHLSIREMKDYARDKYHSIRKASREEGKSTLSFEIEMGLGVGEEYAGTIAKCVQYERITLITKLHDDSLLLNGGGFTRPSIRSKMNKHLPYGFQVFEKANVWYITKPVGWEVFYRRKGSNGDIDAGKRTVVFEDGMMIVPPLHLRGAAAS